MTKTDLIDELARVSRLTKEESEAVVSAVFEDIAVALAKGEKVEIRGLGSFRVRRRQARAGRNPKTGAPISVLEKRVAHFRMGKRLQEVLNA